MTTNHKLVKVKWMPWLICNSCGLVTLKNDRTRWCLQHGCNYDDHPNYLQAMKRFDNA